jgi:hypothetical protein
MLPSSVNDIPEICFLFGNSITLSIFPDSWKPLSGDTIVQNLFTRALSFSTILEKGNGMYNKWRRKAALMDAQAVFMTTAPARLFFSCSLGMMTAFRKEMRMVSVQ